MSVICCSIGLVKKLHAASQEARTCYNYSAHAIEFQHSILLALLFHAPRGQGYYSLPK